MNQTVHINLAVLSAFVSLSLLAMPKANAEGCWDSFSPDRLTSVKIRKMDKAKARDLLVHLHGQGEIVLNDGNGKELNDTSEGKPSYANNGHDQFFDDQCNVKWPKPTDKVYLNQTIAGVAFRYYASGDKNNKTDKPAKKSMRNLDVRNAVGLYWLAKLLKDDFQVSEFYHAGIGQGQGPSTDQHNDGRAVDFVGVKIGSEVYTVLNDWEQESDQAGERPSASRDYAKLGYRLNGKGGTAEDLFRAVYAFAAKNYCDKAGGPSQIGESSDILHPDTPKASLRKGHLAHMHFDISVGPTSY